MYKGPLQINLFQPLEKASTRAFGTLGTVYIDQAGNAYRYCKAGASALSAGKMGVAPVAVANHINKAPAIDVAIAATTVKVVVGATAVTENQYAGGFLQINSGPSAGIQYRIHGNTACASAGTTIVQLAEPVRVAMTAAASKVSLLPDQFNGVIESATATSVPVGVPNCAVPAGGFYFAQIKGVVAALVAGTPAVGSLLTLGAVAGSLAIVSATIATTVAQPILGQVYATAGVDTEYKPVLLNL